VNATIVACGLHEILAQIRGENSSVVRSAWAGAAALRATASPGPAKHVVAADYILPGSSRRHRQGVFDRRRPIFPAASSGAVGTAPRHCGSARLWIDRQLFPIHRFRRLQRFKTVWTTLLICVICVICGSIERSTSLDWW
jgi:hypothetical protein